MSKFNYDFSEYGEENAKIIKTIVFMKSFDIYN